MTGLTHEQVMVLFLGLALLLGAARVLGEVARRLRLPAVLGEILAGVLLGATVLGRLWPHGFEYVFPHDGVNAQVLHAISTLCAVLFMLAAGMEVDLSSILRLRRSALTIAVTAVSLPFALGVALGRVAPAFAGMRPGGDALIFSFFLGIALAIAALPVIAKILMDLKLYRSDLGMVVIAAAVILDLSGWVGFAVILALLRGGGASASAGITMTVLLTLAFTVGLLTIGRWVIDRVLPWIHAHVSWPMGVLSLAVTLGLFGAAIAEWIGIHAIFGAFLVGVAIGDSEHLEQRTRSTVEQFIGSVFAPIFFASLALRVDLIASFDPLLVLMILGIGCATSTVGGALGSRWSGFKWRQSWAIGFALNARGAMGMILALLALEYGLIGERLFTALVTLAIVSSIAAGPLIQAVLRRPRPLRFRDYLSARAYLGAMWAQSREEAIRRLSTVAAPLAGLTADQIHNAVWEREKTMSTALPNGLAVPHGRVAGLEKPLVAVGISPSGVPFDARDGHPAKLILMVLTPPDAHQAQLELLADIAGTFARRDVIDRALASGGFTRFLALLNIESPAIGEGAAAGAAG